MGDARDVIDDIFKFLQLNGPSGQAAFGHFELCNQLILAWLLTTVK